MAPPTQAFDPICAGIFEFLNGWALIAFLATCKAAQGCTTHKQQAVAARGKLERLNMFLADACRREALRLPGFEADELAAARLVAVDPLPSHPGTNMQKLLAATFTLNPALATEQRFLDWIEENKENELGFDHSSDVSSMVQIMNGPGQALHHSLEVEELSDMLCQAPSYTPSWASARRNPELANTHIAMHHPAFLFVKADCLGFPVLLYARGKVARLPWAVVFGKWPRRPRQRL